jgi:hypothetical protein
MNKTKTLETHARSGTRPLRRAAIPSQYKTCPDPAGKWTLFVLGFGVLGAIVANALAFIYVASFYGSG